MNFIELKNVIEDIQVRFPVNQWKHNDIYIWPLIQIYLGNILVKETDFITISKENGIFGQIKSILSSFYYQYIALIKDRKSNIKPNGNFDILIYTLSGDRVLLNDRCYYNKLSSPLEEIFINNNFTVLSIEGYPMPIRYNIPRSGKSYLIQNKLLIARIKSIFQLRVLKKRYKFESLQKFNEFCHFVYDNYGVDSINENFLNEKIVLFYNIRSVFEKILNIVRPKLCITTMYYSIDGMAFVNACHKLNVQACDIQHGVQGEYHLAYGMWKNLPDYGYNLLPHIFLNWSNDEYTVISQSINNAYHTHISIPIGNLWLNKWLNANDEIVSLYDKQIDKLMDSKKINILYTLQSDKIPDWILQFIKSNLNIYFWIRIHPSFVHMLNPINSKLLSNNINNYNLEDATNLPLMALLRNVDLHMTEWSSTVKEAKCFNVLSLILHQNGVDTYNDEITQGYAVVCLNENSLLAAINSRKTDKFSAKERIIDPTGIETLLSIFKD